MTETKHFVPPTVSTPMVCRIYEDAEANTSGTVVYYDPDTLTLITA